MSKLSMPQLFLCVGKNKFAPVDSVIPGKSMYAWDGKKKQIVPYQSKSTPIIMGCSSLLSKMPYTVCHI